MTTRRDSNRDSKRKDESLAATALMMMAGGVVVWLVVRWLSRQSPLTLAGVAAAAVAVLFGCWALWPRQRLPRHRVRHMRLRARLRLHPGRGHATVAELSLRWGRLAAAYRARRSRRSLPRLTRLLRASQTSVLLARGHYGHRLRVPVEEHVIYVSPPRAGKTATLADIIARYPGPVVATSTRGDLYELTAAARAARGPVYVWNPQRLADVPSTMRWDVLGGCADPATAIRRAQPLSSIASFKGEGEDFWAASVALWMQTLLHVAALQQTTMDQVHSWALQKVPEDFLAALPAAGGEAERWGHLIKGQMTSAASRTTDTIRYMLAASLAFMVDPMLRTAVQPGPGQFDPARFAGEGGTLYLIAESRDERPSPVAGLFAALVMEIYHQAAQAAARLPGGRLDPPMLWALDEITQTCPVPLPSLLADAGGRGIQIMPVVHGVAQLRSRWGKDGARTILDTCGTKVFLPGISDTETLEMASKLSGTTAARERGHEHDSRHPVMTEDMIRQLPARRDGTGYAFILRNGLSPVIGRPPVIWHGQLWRRLTRRAHQPPPTHQTEMPPAGPWPDEDPPAAHALPPRGPAPAPAPAAPPVALPAPPRPGGNRPARARRAWDSIGGQS